MIILFFTWRERGQRNEITHPGRTGWSAVGPDFERGFLAAPPTQHLRKPSSATSFAACSPGRLSENRSSVLVSNPHTAVHGLEGLRPSCYHGPALCWTPPQDARAPCLWTRSPLPLVLDCRVLPDYRFSFCVKRPHFWQGFLMLLSFLFLKIEFSSLHQAIVPEPTVWRTAGPTPGTPSHC